MKPRSTVEIFSAGCARCAGAAHLVTISVPADHTVSIRADHDPSVAERARSLGIDALPAVLIDGKFVIRPPAPPSAPDSAGV